MLTSYDDGDLHAAGYRLSVSDLVEARAQQAQVLGVDGLVSSPEEAASLRKIVGHQMSLVTPGTDLVVYDPSYRGKISAKTHLMNVDYNSFEGFGDRPHVVTVRGKVAARDGEFVGEFGRGRFLEREPSFS